MHLENRLVVANGGGGGSGVVGELGVNRCTLLLLEWISNEILLCFLHSLESFRIFIQKTHPGRANAWEKPTEFRNKQQVCEMEMSFLLRSDPQLGSSPERRATSLQPLTLILYPFFSQICLIIVYFL